MESFAELLCKVRQIALSPGSLQGSCAFCGRTRADLVKIEMKDSFTIAEFLHGYNFACPACYHFYRDPVQGKFYRNHNWIITQAAFNALERNEVLDAVLSLQDVAMPFGLYTTNTYQRQGFLRLLGQGLNFSKSFMTIAWDMQLIQISADKIRSIMQFCGWCEDNGIYRSEIISGQVRARTMQSIEQKTHNSLQFLRILRRWSKQIPFQWVAAFFPKEYQAVLKKHGIVIENGWNLT